MRGVVRISKRETLGVQMSDIGQIIQLLYRARIMNKYGINTALGTQLS